MEDHSLLSINTIIAAKITAAIPTVGSIFHTTTVAQCQELVSTAKN